MLAAGLRERVAHIRLVLRLEVLGSHSVMSVVPMLVRALEPLVALLLLQSLDMI